MKKNILYLFVPFCIKASTEYLQNNIYGNNLYSQKNITPLQNDINQRNQNLEAYGWNNLQYPSQNYMPINHLIQGYTVNNAQNQLLNILEKYYLILSKTFKDLNNKIKLKQYNKKKSNQELYNDCSNWKSELDFLHNQYIILKNGIKELLELALQNSSELERNYSNSVLTSIEDRSLLLEENILKLKGELNKKIIKLTKKNLTKTQSFFSKIFS